jgi:VWFA-related protein
MLNKLRLTTLLIASLLFLTTYSYSQDSSKTPSRDTSTTSIPQEDKIQILSEEVRLPLFAYDDYGNIDYDLTIDDILLLEDNIRQEVKSINRIPANVLLVLGTGGEINSLLNINTTRDLALNLISKLHKEDKIAILQFNWKTELLQDWTSDRVQLEKAIRKKTLSGKGSNLALALEKAAELVQYQPLGNRHVILVTDGVSLPAYLSYKEIMKELETQPTQAKIKDAFNKLLATQSTIHLFNYTVSADESATLQSPHVELGPENMKTSQDVIDDVMKTDRSIKLLMPKAKDRFMSVGVDFQMRRLRKAYEQATLKGTGQLATLAKETGGNVMLYRANEDVSKQAERVGREIGTQYTITYKPIRSLASAQKDEYRDLKVVSRRVGLRLRTKRGYIAKPIN